MTWRIMVMPVHNAIDAILNGRINDGHNQLDLTLAILEICIRWINAQRDSNQVGVPVGLQIRHNLGREEGRAFGEAWPVHGHSMQRNLLAIWTEQFASCA